MLNTQNTSFDVSSSWLPERVSGNKINLYLLALMKDDACKIPYILIDEFGINITRVRKGQKRLSFKDTLSSC